MMGVVLYKPCPVVNLTGLHLFWEDGSSLLGNEPVPGVVFCEVRNLKGFDRKRIAAVMLGITCSRVVSGGGFWVMPFSPSMARELCAACLCSWLLGSRHQQQCDHCISGDCWSLAPTLLCLKPLFCLPPFLLFLGQHRPKRIHSQVLSIIVFQCFSLRKCSATVFYMGNRDWQWGPLWSKDKYGHVESQLFPK